MKFDFIIGNPPFNEEAPGTSTSDKPIYHLFMNEAFELSDKVELITPARFLFDAGATPTAWNKKMLSDNHFKVLFYEANTKNIFSSAEIPGGIAITYRDNNADFGQIGTFTAYQELNSILKKTMPFLNSQGSLNLIVYKQNKFNLDILNTSIPDLDRIDKRLESNIFKLNIFTEKPLCNDDLKIIGLFENKRVFRYVDRKFIDIDNSPNIDRYKIILSKSNGASGTLGIEPARLITMPFIGEPYLGYTRTFIGIGAFDSLYEANAALKYVKGKFARAMLGILKVTQDNNPDKWKYVPLQDFTSNSDIDWTKSIPEIDKQLYAKYSLDEKEIEFIETHVKEME